MLVGTGPDRPAGGSQAGRRGGPGSRPGPAVFMLAAAAALVLGAAACSSGSPAGSPAPASGTPAPAAGSCAWPTLISAQTYNNVVPDAAASVWVQPIVVHKNLRIVISGRYPDARYASFSVYTSGGSSFTSNGAGSSLPDYRIAPDRGSVNPWQHRAAPGGRFTVTLRADVSPGQVNTLPLPAGTSSGHPGYLMYRVYLPAGGSFSRVQLPALTLRQGHAARTLPACRSHNSPVPAPATAPASAAALGQPAGSSPAAAPVPRQLQFFKPAQPRYGGLLPNADSAYVLAYLVPPAPSDVVVVTAKAPASAPGSHPSVWPAPGEDVRYWSMCIGLGAAHLPTVVNKLPGGKTDYGCRADDATKLDSSGDNAFVIGTESQRAAIDRIPGATFLPFSTSQPTALHLLLLRNMLVSRQFPHSVQAVAQAGDPAAAAAAMGPYYPRATICPLSVLAAKGPQACAHHS